MSLATMFKLDERKTNVKTEIIAGLTTFMTMAYILVVQPGAICGYGPDAGITDAAGVFISKEAIMVMTALISGLITLLMGFYSNFPFALSTGLGSNFMFGAMLASGTCTFGRAMLITLISGIIFVLLSIFGIRDIIVKMMPKSIKVSSLQTSFPRSKSEILERETPDFLANSSCESPFSRSEERMFKPIF